MTSQPLGLAVLRAKAEAAIVANKTASGQSTVWFDWYEAVDDPAMILRLLDRITYLENELEAELRVAAQGRQAPR